MRDEHSTLSFRFDFSLHFNQAIKDLRSIHGRKLQKGSQNYWVLFALFEGDVIDDYNHKPLSGETAKPIHNIKTRVSDLSNKFNIKIDRRFNDASHCMKYWIAR